MKTVLVSLLLLMSPAIFADSMPKMHPDNSLMQPVYEFERGCSTFYIGIWDIPQVYEAFSLVEKVGNNYQWRYTAQISEHDELGTIEASGGLYVYTAHVVLMFNAYLDEYVPDTPPEECSNKPYPAFSTWLNKVIGFDSGDGFLTLDFEAGIESNDSE